jgi:phospholipase/carboxylesterase
VNNPHVCQPVAEWGEPAATAERIAVVVHGRDQDPTWMYEHLVSRLDVPGTSYAAPSAADRSWYPAGFMAPRADNEPGCTWGLACLHALVAELVDAGHGEREISLLGFSQGACLVLEYVSRHGGDFGGVAALTGGLIGPPGTAWHGPPLDGVPVLLATSDVSEWVPLTRVEETRRVLEARGAEVTLRVYEGMGHEINDDEIALVEALLGATPRGRRDGMNAA